ncbi:imidazoleglycerol-phosphate dehydratase [Candidatus Vidania fulgoroideorum]
MRKLIFRRQTKEVRIFVRLNIISTKIRIKTSVRFLDHMIEQLSAHAGIGIMLYAKGDRRVDNHHIIEDVGIALGKAIRIFYKHNKIKRYSNIILPMDEAITFIAIDISGRGGLYHNINYRSVGAEQFFNIVEFFKSLACSAYITLHIYSFGIDIHHRTESCFKAMALCLRHVFRLPQKIISLK